MQKTIDILGLGESISTYKKSENETIGVNDIFKYHRVDHLLVMDHPHRFTKERLSTIITSTPNKFYSSVRDQFGQYVWMNLVRNFVPIQTERGRGFLKTLGDPNVYSLSNNTPFTACVMAYKMGAKKIIMHGVDFKTHPHLSKENAIESVLKHFKQLRIELENRGVKLYVSSNHSALSSVVPSLAL